MPTSDWDLFVLHLPLKGHISFCAGFCLMGIGHLT
jgi:hypothetical protein